MPLFFMFKLSSIEANLFVCFPVPRPAKNLFLFLTQCANSVKVFFLNCSEINKRLPGPHFDPPSKEQVKTLMQVCFAHQIFS